MSQLDITMDRGGYFYAYLVNESPTSVYFDDFKVTYSAGKVLEENHYYPFGMLNAQLSTRPTEKPLNNYKYNGKELQKELNLEWLDYGARFYDAQIGRWHAIDPLAEVSRRWSPYTYGYNSPTTVIDPDGMLAQSFIDELWNKSSDGNEWTNWTNNDNGSFSSNTGETANNDNPPQGKNNQSSTNTVPETGKGVHLSTINDLSNSLGYLSGAIGAYQIGMIDYRYSLPLSSKIGTFSRFSSTYRLLGNTSNILGGAATYVGGPLSIGLDYRAMQNGQISGGLFAYRTTGTLSSIGGGFSIGAAYGGPWGAIGGALIGGGFVAGEYIYEGIKYMWNETLRQISNFENGIKSGWYPGRSK